MYNEGRPPNVMAGHGPAAPVDDAERRLRRRPGQPGAHPGFSGGDRSVARVWSL